MTGTVDIGALIAAHPWRIEALEAVAGLGLPDAWIGAGFVRNAVWDRLQGHARPTPPNDIDVIYFDADDIEPARDAALEARLNAALPAPWSVANQGRMHARNGDPPYRSTADALGHWLETPTAVAVSLAPSGRLSVLAPFGLDDLIAMTVRPTPHARAGRMAAYRWRMKKKNWPAIWPRVRVLEA